MTQQTTLSPGGTIPYSTRPVGMTTNLFLQANEHGAQAQWQALLVNHGNNDVTLGANEFKKIDISFAGAIVEVRNEGETDFLCWTDY